MNSKRRAVIQYGISGLLTVFFLYLAFRGTDWEQLATALENADYFWILLMVPCVLISHGFRALRWRVLLAPVKEGISINNLFSAIMVGYLVNNFLPRAGELVRPYTLGRRERISKSAAFGTVVVERIIDGWTLFFLLLLFLFLDRGPLNESFPWLPEVALAGAAMTAAISFMVVLLVNKREWGLTMVRFVSRPLPQRLALRVEAIVLSFLDGFLFVKKPRQYLAVVFLSLVIWGWYVLMLYLPFNGFDLVGRYSLGPTAATIVVLVTGVGMMIPTPGATGTYHSLATETLVRMYGVDRMIALSYATVTHAVGFLAITLVGLIYLYREQVSISEAMRAQASPSNLAVPERAGKGDS